VSAYFFTNRINKTIITNNLSMSITTF